MRIESRDSIRRRPGRDPVRFGPPLVLGCVILISLLAWLPALRNGFVWDDRPLVVENPKLVQPSAVSRAFVQDFWESEERAGHSDYYRPLITVSYWLNRRWGGLNPVGYHLTNLLIHAAGLVFLFFFLRRFGISPMLAGVATATVGVHPSLAEPVAWISGRTDSLAALFFFLALWLDSKRAHPLWRVATDLAFALALLSKETAVTFPLVAAIVARSRGLHPSLGSALRARWDSILLLGAYLVVRVAVLGSLAGGIGHPTLPFGALPVGTRLVALLHLPGILLLPWADRIECGGSLPATTLLPGAIAGLCLFAFLIKAPKKPISKLRTLSSPVSSMTICGLIVFLPDLAVVLRKGVVADRLIYLSAYFWIPALVLGLKERLPARPARLLAVISLVGLSLFSAWKSTWWTSDLDFFQRASRAPHASARVYLNLGSELHNRGRLAEALPAIQRALSETQLKRAHYMLGLLYTELGWDGAAIREYQTELTLYPGETEAANNLAVVLTDHGLLLRAERVLADALSAPDRDPSIVRSNLQNVRNQIRRRGNAPDPAPPAEESLRPELLQDARFLNRRALDSLRKRRLEQAHVLILAALEADPGLVDAQLSLAQYEIVRGETARARTILLDVLRRDPANEPARQLLARIESAGGAR